MPAPAMGSRDRAVRLGAGRFEAPPAGRVTGAGNGKRDRAMTNPWGATNMIVTTTHTVDGRKIATYHGIVVGEAILGANVFRDVFAGITDILGGRSGSYERALGEARGTALGEMEEDARKLRALGVARVYTPKDFELNRIMFDIVELADPARVAAE